MKKILKTMLKVFLFTTMPIWGFFYILYVIVKEIWEDISN